MANTSSLALFKETRVDLEPRSPDSTVYVPIAAHGQLHRTSRTAQQKNTAGQHALAEDEDAFSRLHLATSGSVYFRRNQSHPRSFLWRVLEDSKVLELRAIDLTKGEHDRDEAGLTLRLAFAHPIRNGGVALSDTEEHDFLCVFVLTKRNELYTHTLRPDAFCRAAATEGNTQEWSKTFVPASFSISKPHSLLAVSPYELWASLQDGRLLRLTRGVGDDGTRSDAKMTIRTDVAS